MFVSQQQTTTLPTVQRKTWDERFVCLQQRKVIERYQSFTVWPEFILRQFSYVLPGRKIFGASQIFWTQHINNLQQLWFLLFSNYGTVPGTLIIQLHNSNADPTTKSNPVELIITAIKVQKRCHYQPNKRIHTWIMNERCSPNWSKRQVVVIIPEFKLLYRNIYNNILVLIIIMNYITDDRFDVC